MCGWIAYEIEGELGPIFNCHCSRCRRWHGAAFRTRASVRREQFRWVRGRSHVSAYQSSDNVTRMFCSQCGSPLISVYKDRPDVIGLPLGGLEQDPGRRPEAHIFVGSKSPWYSISDDLPRYDAWPGSEEKVRETE